MRKGLVIVACLIVAFVWMAIPSERSSGGKSQSEWIAALGDPVPAKRSAAVVALGDIGREEYLHMASARHSLLIIFEKCGWRTQALMIPPMVERLGDEDEAVRTAALASLVKVGEYALWDLRDSLHCGNSAVEWGSIVAINKIDPKNGALALDMVSRREAPHPYYARYFPRAPVQGPSTPWGR